MSTSWKAWLALFVALGMSWLATHAGAAPITWIGGNVAWVNNAGDGNWDPADEPDSVDEAIFNTPNNVTLGSGNLIVALTMSGGIGLNTSGFDLSVIGLVQVTGSSTDLIISGANSDLSADDVTINNLGEVRLDDGNVFVPNGPGGIGIVDINAGGTLSGHGEVSLDSAAPAVTALLINDGTLSASPPPVIIGGVPPTGTLTINVADAADGRVDLDGTGGNGVVNVFRNQTLEINGALNDAFSGDINLGHNSTLDISPGWALDSGTIDVNNGFASGTPPLIPDVPADVAYIAGGSLTQTGGTITVIDTDGTLQFDAVFVQTGGNLVNNGKVVFNANSTIAAGANFTMPTNNSSITVNSGVTVNVDQANFNADGNETGSNVITVNSGGLLDLDLGAGGDGVFDNVVTLNGGELDVTTSGGTWMIERTFNLNNTGGSPAVLDGNTLLIGNDAGALDANLLVGGAGPSQINTTAIFSSDADVNIAAGATLEINGSATFDAANGANNAEFTGSGILELDGVNNTVSEVMTVNMPGGRIDLDGSGGILANTQTLTLGGSNADVTLNVTAIDSTDNSFGKSGLLSPDTIVLNQFSDLTVHLTDPNDEWTLNASAVLDINAVGGMLGGSGIQGSDFNMAGTATISGNSIWTARTDISGTATVSAAGSLNLRGGDLVDTNRLEGGAIAGAGVLRALVDEALFGFGIIDTDIEFANNTELRADDGTLRVNGPIVEVGAIGTADVDGILNVVLPWNTNVADLVELKGGEIRGAAIINGGAAGINGRGLVSARVINNTRLDAEGGGTLVVNTPANDNDWDGAGNAGQLNAVSGNLEIADDAMFTFQGSVSANNGFGVFVNGFQMDIDPAASITLAGGTYRATNSARIGGSVSSNVAPSTLQFNGLAQFQATSTTVLNADLRLDNVETLVVAGATFSGGGSLVNLAGRELTLDDTANVAVVLENDGVLEIEGAADGQADVDDFQQSASGQLNIDLGGTGLNDFDRLDVNGAAQLAGTLDLSLFGGYVPSVLDPAMTILSATSGRTGIFTAVNQPPTMPAGLMFDVIYTPTLVQLQVVNAPTFSADFDLDGDVDDDDLSQWEGDYSVNGESDADDDGDSDGADFLAWQQQLGSGVPAASANGAVPEPAAGALLLVGMLGILRRRTGAVCHAPYLRIANRRPIAKVIARPPFIKRPLLVREAQLSADRDGPRSELFYADDAHQSLELATNSTDGAWSARQANSAPRDERPRCGALLEPAQ